MESDLETEAAQIVDTRHREIAIEHLVFGTLRFVASRYPDLLDELDESLDHLWDKAVDETRDDEAVRSVARLFIKGLRAGAGKNADLAPKKTPRP